MALTQEEYDELQRQFLEPKERRTEVALPSDAMEAEARALEAAKQSAFDESLYMYGPQVTEEELRENLAGSEQRAEQRVEEAKRVIRQPGYETAPYEVPIGRSRLVVGTGGQVMDEETGDLRPASAFEQITEAVKRKRLAEADPFAEKIRMVREGEATREEVLLPNWVDVNIPTSGAGIEESVFAAGIRFLGALEPFVNEGVFGGDRLFYAADKEGVPLDDDSFAYQAEELLKKYAPGYAAQGRLIPELGAIGLEGEDREKYLAEIEEKFGESGREIGSMLLDAPRPFQATTRHMGLQAATREGDYFANVASQIHEGRATGNELESLTLYDRDMREIYGDETVLGMSPAFLVGTAYSAAIPTPLGPMFNLVKLPAKGTAAAAKAASKATRARGLDTVADILQPWETAKKLASRKAARDALGVDISDIRDPLESPSLRSIAVDRAVSPLASAVELKGVVTEAMGTNGRLNYDEMSRRFGGNESAARMLQQAYQMGDDALKGAGEIDPRALDAVVENFSMAGEYKNLLDLLKAGKVNTTQVVYRLEKLRGKQVAQRLATLTDDELQTWLSNRMRAAGMVPNVQNRFIASMYSTARKIMKDMDAGVPAGEMVARSLKGAGNNRRLFQDNLLRAIMEEAQAAGKDVARVVGRHARKKPTPRRLMDMVDALGDGRGSVAIGNAFRETMMTVGRDRIMQHLPDDYVFVSGRMMVPEKVADKTRRAMGRMAQQLFEVVGRDGSKKIVAAGESTMDDVIRVFTQEAGAVAAGSTPASRTAQSVLKKLRQGSALDNVEMDYFERTMRDAIARKIVGSVEAVTEGAQTALARNSVALRNSLYTDAYSGVAVSRLARAARTSIAALHEVIPIARQASKGNAAASMVVAPSAADGLTKTDVGFFKSWYETLVRNPATTLKELTTDPLYKFKPETSVVSETYARQMADAVGSAADRMIGRLAELAEEGIKGPRAITRVLREMGQEVDAMTVQQFNRTLMSHVESRGVTTDEGILEEAMLTARYMVRQAKTIEMEGKFKLGEGVIDKMLKENGFTEGIEGLATLPLPEALQRLRGAVVRAKSIENNSESWVSLMTTLMPGESQLKAILGEDSTVQRPVNMLLADAVKAVQKGGGMLDAKGNLIPNIENSRAVLELLAEKNGADVLDSTLQYSNVMSVVKKAFGKRPDAWSQGLQSWLVHQRAGLDASKVYIRMADENPQMLLDLVPANAQTARKIQAQAVSVVVEGMMDMERKLLGVEPDRAKYMAAFADAARVLSAADDPIGRQLDPLGRAIFQVMRDMEAMDWSIRAEDRLSLASSVMKRMAQGRGGIPDLGQLGDRLVGELSGYRSGYLAGMTDNQRKMLGTKYQETAARANIGEPFQRHIERMAELHRVDIGMPENLFGERIADLMYHGVLSGTDQSLLAPVFRQLEWMFRQSGVRLDGGDIPGLDGVVFSPRAVRPQYGPVHYMNAESGVHAALTRIEAAVASGRLQASLEDLQIRAKLKEEGVTGLAAKSTIAVRAAQQLAQTAVRVVRSTMLAGGGPFLALSPNPLYHAGNVQSVPEILIGTLGADMAMKVLAQVPEGAKSAARNAQSWLVRKTVTRAMAPFVDDADVVIKSPFYGDITARELDKMMDMAGIKFSRASIEAYESIGQQMAQAARINLTGDPLVTSGNVRQFFRMFNPASMNEWMRFAEDTDGITRRATFIAALADGRTVDEAAMLARESLLDYGKVAATGNSASKFMQKWTMYWAFRRQSLIMTLNNLADSKFGRQEMMGRWIRLQARQKQGASPEEFLFGPDYIKFRMYATPGVDDVGFTAGAPSVMSEGAADLLGWMATIGVGFDAVAGEGDFRNFFGMLMDTIQQENLDLLSTTVAEVALLASRMDDKGPLVSDVLMAQMLGFDSMTNANVTPALIEFFGLVVDRDPETGEPVVTPGRPYLQSEGDVLQRPHQFRFGTTEGYLSYVAVRTLLAITSMGRSMDEWTKIALTLEGLVPEGFKPQYRALAGTVEYMTRTGTPMRATDKDEQRARVQRQQQRRVQRAGR